MWIINLILLIVTVGALTYFYNQRYNARIMNKSHYFEWELRDRNVTIQFTALASVILAITLPFLIGLALKPQPVPTTMRTEKIVAASAGVEGAGRWSLFSGYYNEEPVYYYYSQEADGAFVLKHTPSRAARIYEDQEGGSFVDIYTFHCSNWHGAYWIKPCNEYLDNYSFHVPPGSVNREVTFNTPGN